MVNTSMSKLCKDACGHAPHALLVQNLMKRRVYSLLTSLQNYELDVCKTIGALATPMVIEKDA